MIFVVNETRYSPAPPGGWASMVRLLAAAADKQLRYDFAPPWHSHPMRVTPVAGSPITCHLVDDDKNVPGALAYHSNRGALVDIVVMVNTILKAGGTWITGPLSVSAGLTHETLEAEADPYCQEWWTDYNAGRNVAKEVCDPVQAESYTVSIASGGGVAELVAVSNFVYPLWGVSDASSGQYDHLARRTAPFQMARGGYDIVQAIGAEGQITRAVVDHDWQPTDVTRPGGGYRSMRRGGY